MNKYIEPPKKTEVSAMNKLADAAKNTDKSLLKSVEDACTEAYNSTVDTIKEMADTAVKAATGAIITTTQAANNLMNQANKATSEFVSSVEEAYDDFMADEISYTGSEYQGTVLNNANETINNLSPKQLKEMADDPTKVIEMSKELTSTGQSNLKTKILS